MSYKVTHSERYVPDKSEKVYANLEEMENRYNVYWNYIENDILVLDVGENTNVRYDDYVSLNVEKLA